jgi:DNA repair protein SbcC/Rad50
MIPLRLTASSYRRFHSLDLSITEGVMALSGSNGSGKSSIVEGFELALFGRCRTGPLSAQVSRGEDVLELVFEFEHQGERFRVRRGFSARGRGRPTLDFERWEEDE